MRSSSSTRSNGTAVPTSDPGCRVRAGGAGPAGDRGSGRARAVRRCRHLPPAHRAHRHDAARSRCVAGASRVGSRLAARASRPKAARSPTRPDSRARPSRAGSASGSGSLCGRCCGGRCRSITWRSTGCIGRPAEECDGRRELESAAAARECRARARPPSASSRSRLLMRASAIAMPRHGQTGASTPSRSKWSCPAGRSTGSIPCRR